jgi:hypothetical protein
MTLKSSDNTKVIRLTFSSFSTESGYDYLYIYDGTNTNGPLLWSGSGAASPGTVTSTYGALTMKFYSDGNTNSTGWSTSITCVTPASTNINMFSGGQRYTNMCSGNSYDAGGSGGNYSNSEDGILTIDNGQPVTLTFSSFNVENHATCSYDWLKIFNSNNTSTGLVGTYCGTSLPPNYTSTGPLTIQWHSDAGIVAAGWAASWTCCATNGGTSSASTNPICTGASTTLSLSGATAGSTYQWQSSPDNSSWSNISGATSSTYVASPVTNTYYKCVVTNGCSANSTSTLVSVTPNPSGGTASASSSSLCSGTTTILSLSGSTGNIQWEQSSDNTTWSNVSGGSGATSTSYTTPAISSNVYYRAKVTNSPCSGTVYSNSVLISVVTCVSMSNGTTTACTGNFFDDGGASSNYTASKDFTRTFTPSSGYSVTMTFNSFNVESHGSCAYDYLSIYDGPNTSSPLIGTYCGTNSPGTVTSSSSSLTFFWHSDSFTETAGWSATWTCCSTNPGSAAGGTTLCGGGNANLSISGFTVGSSLQWQSSSTSSGPWTNISGATSANLTVSPVSTTFYRCRVTNGCTTSSNVLTVNVSSTPSNPPNPYSNQNPDCGRVKILEATSTSSNILYYWQGTNASGTSTNNNANIPFFANSSGTYYVRAYNSSTGCWSPGSGSIAVTVTGPTGGTVSGGTTVCGLTTNSTSLSLSGHSGNIIRWEKSVSPFTYWDPITNTTSTCNVINVSEETRIRAVIQSTVCSATASSNYTTITVTNASSANAGIDQYICSGTTATLAASGVGIWSVVGGSAVVTTPSSPVSSVTALSSGPNVFQWSVSGSCPDFVVITRP